MDERQADVRVRGSEADTAMKRRGILAAAVVAGIVAKLAQAPVLAASGGGDQGFLALGSNPWYTGAFRPVPTIPPSPPPRPSSRHHRTSATSWAKTGRTWCCSRWTPAHRAEPSTPSSA
jgi:hypothetical protein